MRDNGRYIETAATRTKFPNEIWLIVLASEDTFEPADLDLLGFSIALAIHCRVDWIFSNPDNTGTLGTSRHTSFQ